MAKGDAGAAYSAYQELVNSEDYRKYKDKLGGINPWIEGGDKKAVWNWNTINAYKDKLSAAKAQPAQVEMTPEINTAMGLADITGQKSQDALTKQREEENALMNAYKSASKGIYSTAAAEQEKALMNLYQPTTQDASGKIIPAITNVEQKYNEGQSALEKIIGEQSKAQIEQSLQPIENTLAAKGLTGGPSGALNEALARAAERVRTEGISRLADFQGQRTAALAGESSNTSQLLAALRGQYGANLQGLEATSLANALAGTQKGTELTDKYGMAGLEAVLGTNKTVIEQSGQQDLMREQARINAEATAAIQAQKSQQLKAAQENYDKQLQSLAYSLRQQSGYGQNLDLATFMAEATRILGPRPA